MRDPAFYPHQPRTVETVETQISTVFIAGDRVYKLKKEVVLPFLDYGTLERRRELCHEEVRLNRRLAPDTYLGVRAIVPRGEAFVLAEPDHESAVEYAIEMRRLPRHLALDRQVESSTVSLESIDRVARRIAQFHAEAAQPPPGRGYGTPAEVKARMDENLEAALPWVGSIIEHDAFAAIERFQTGFLLRNRELLAERMRRGRVRECHGDLRAEHVVLDDGQVTVYDCVEFDEQLRFIDVASDLAFLYMDLQRLGAAGLAAELERAYIEHSGDEEVRRLLPFFACYRTWVRIKIACLKLEQHEGGSADRAALVSEVRSLAALSHRLLWRSRLPVVLVFSGVGASGKSTLADRIAKKSGLHHLSSDVIRKELAGVPVDQRASESTYDESSTMQTYDDLLVEVLEITGATGGAVVDATFGRRHRRMALADSLRGSGARVLFIECRAPESVLRKRAAGRERSPERGSDATWTIIGRQIEEFEPLEEVPARDHLVLRTDRPIAEAGAEVEAFIGRAIEGA